MKNLSFYVLLFAISGLSIMELSAQKISFGSMRARDIGPAVMSGRITDIDAVTNQPEIVYLATATGGVWKSRSGGTDFRPVFDEHTMAIGSVKIDQNHPDTVWVGTGEPWVRNSVSVGTGIYVSLNGGTTWEQKGLANSERIAKIHIDPRNSKVIYAAVQGHLWNANEERGVYKSSDFGATWEKVLYVDENTGCADLSMDPNNPDVLYAAMWEHRRYPDFFTSGGKGSALYKTTDGGKTWNKVHTGFPAGEMGRIAVEVAPSNSNVLYATLETEAKDGKGLYRSNDAGANWKKVNGGFGMTVRPFYFSRLDIDPNNEDVVFKCGLNLVISKDGGETFRTVESGVHSDIHAVWVNPNNSKHVLVGTDGGGYISLDGGYQFRMFMDLPLAQFYHLSVDNAEPYNVYGGLQDNGSWMGPSEGSGGVQNKDWRFVNGGDGFYVLRHPTDENVVYAESQGGNLVRHDLRNGQTRDIKPLEKAGEAKYRFNWNAPIHISATNPERMYFGAQFLFKTENRGDSWQKISPDLTSNDPQRQRQGKSGGLSIDNSTAENNTTIYAIAESPVDENIIWVGTDDGYLQVSSNAGGNWTNVALNIQGLPKFTWCTGLEPSHFDKNTCYVTFDGHKQGDKAVYVYKTTDLGKTWTSLATPTIEGYALSIREDLQAPNLLFLGTEFGLYISVDSGVNWKRFKNNFPKAGVRAMVIHPRDNALIAGTHGRGVYIIDDLTPLRQITPEVATKKLHFFDLEPSIIQNSGQGAWFGGAGNYIGSNPPSNAYIAYYMKKRHTFGKMSLEVFDEKGKFIKELPAGKSAGINIVELPVRLPNPKAAPTNNRMALFGSVLTPTLPEGTYTIKIKKGKKEEYSTKLVLAADPKSPHTAADRQGQHELSMLLYNMTNKLGYLYHIMGEMNEQASERSKDSKRKLKKLLDAFATDVKKYQGTLVSLEGDFYVDEGEAAIREEISTLYLGVSQYPGRPSEGQQAKGKELINKMTLVDNRYQEFRSRVNGLNIKLKKAGQAPIKVKLFEEYMAE